MTIRRTKISKKEFCRHLRGVIGLIDSNYVSAHLEQALHRYENELPKRPSTPVNTEEPPHNSSGWPGHDQ